MVALRDDVSWAQDSEWDSSRVRIGTWNLDARWTLRHAAALLAADCDVWLLTEVPESAELPGYQVHFGQARMARGQSYAGVLSRQQMADLPDPHPASAAVEIGGVTFCSTVLPWAAKDDLKIWGPGNQGERTEAAARVLAAALPNGTTVWGGDFNHAVAGPTRDTGSLRGRKAIQRSVEQISAVILTADLAHRLKGICTIDHIAVPRTWVVESVHRVEVAALSDHDIYLASATPA